MDIDLRLPSGDHDKEEETNGIVNLLDHEEKLDGVEVGGDMDIEEKIHVEDGGEMNSPMGEMGEFKEDVNLEPLAGMEFESHGEAYAYYQEYARSMGFNTAIQNSRRSKTSREFIDAKFACSRYGTKREYEKPANRPRSRQGSKQDQENATGRRACAKTDCKASMHVKRRPDGKWIIHRFEKEHNHELMPAQAVSEQTRRMYAAMARQFAEYKNVVGLKHDSRSPSDKVRNLAMEAGEANILLEFFIQMQSMNSNFFYAVDVSEDHRLKNLFWTDAKSRHDYANFSDVVSFDTTYLRNKYKMPLALFIGVNQHYQFMLLGCALLSDESSATFSWVMRTWLKAMGDQAPKIIITDLEMVMKSVVSEILPSTLHFFCQWQVLGKVSENLNHIIKQNEEFMAEFENCIYRSWTDEEFEKSWQNLVQKFELGENELMLSLYEDRTKWVPTFMKNAFLAGMSTALRSESVNSFFDKYVHRKTTIQEFVKQYEAILQDRYEEEAKADSDTWNKQPALKSPSPFEKHVAGVYTHAVFKKFQVEVVAAVACIPKDEKRDETAVTFIIQDFEKSQEFTVTWNGHKSEVSCMCHMFEYKGFLCRHAMVVLQIGGISTIPPQYILKRWTKDAKVRFPVIDGSEGVQSRVQRYNSLSQQAMRLAEEGSLSQESYRFAVRSLDETFGNCVDANSSNKNLVDAGTTSTPGLLCTEEDNQNRSMSKMNKKKNNPTKKRKARPPFLSLSILKLFFTLSTVVSFSNLKTSSGGLSCFCGSFRSPDLSLQGKMGLLSRKLFPACESMCICCPALRSRSRQPVKRYKKLLADIFPKSPDGSANGRKIMKLCEYAAKNPFRIPKIAKCLEERCYKELRSGHTKLVNVIAEVYNELLCMCKEQMACFAVNLLNVVVEMLDCAKTDAVKTIGCLTFTKFIYSQVDGTYTYNIENVVQKVCSLARETGEEDQKRCLRASSLRCLSAMVWFMAEFSHIFADFDEIVHVTLDNYEPDAHNEDDERGEAHHNWVDEVIRSEGRDVGNENRPGYLIRKRPEKKDISLLTREEIEMPKIWAHICIQRMADLAKESTTMRRVLDPMFIHFDNNKHWVPRHGLAFVVLSDMSYFVESSGNHQLILTGVVRHLDHKNVACDSQIKSFVIQTATALARQIRLGGGFSDIGFVSDLCRHLRKSLQATVDLAGEEINLNLTLQTSIQECLLETVKGIFDARPLFDMMAMTLEKLPSHKVVARATMGSLIILAHTISIASLSSNSQQVFPDGLFIQLLRVMLHPDVEIRIGGHHIFSVLLVTSSNYMRHDAPSHTRRWNSSGASTFSSITALLDKLRREKDATKLTDDYSIQDGFKEKDNIEEERKQGRAQRNSPNFHKLNSIIDRTVASASLTDTDPSTLKLNEDQITQLLSAFWFQANMSDNLPANVEAITQSFCLTLISLRLRNTENNLVVRFFQLPLSLLKIALEPNESMPPAYQRLLLVSSTAMLSFAAKMCQVSDLNSLLKPLRECNLDPFLGVGDDYQVYMKPRADLREYGSTSDNQIAAKFLSELRNKSIQSLETIQSTLVESLSRITQLETDDLVKQMSEGFTPDDTFLFGLQSMVDMDHIQVLVHSRESPSYDGDFLTNSSAEDDKISESSVTDMTRFMPTSPSPSSSRIVNIGQLLESALEVAGQVAGTFVSTSPLPYGAMASQCETLGTDTRKKLSNWLAHENHYTKAAADVLLPAIPGNGLLTAKKTIDEDSTVQQGAMVAREPWLAIRLPPASPFDNFLRAARC